MHVEDIAYEADDRRMVGHLAVDRDRPGTRPAVLLCHEGPGLFDNIKERAERLAGLGYVAFALDYFGDGKPLPLDGFQERLGELMGDADRTRAIGRAGLDILLAQPNVDPGRVAAIGFCFGGAMALELARGGADLKAIVGFHPGLGTTRPEDARNITGSVLMCVGSEDPFATADDRLAFEREMRDGGVRDWRLELYGGVQHTFTNELADASGMPGVAYDEAADRRSWQSMLALFDETLGPV